MKLITDKIGLTVQNAFMIFVVLTPISFFITSTKNGGDAFSRTGWWYAADEHFIDIEDLTLELLKMLSPSRNERRVLKTSQGRKRFFNDKPRLTDFSILPQAKLLFTDEFMSRDIFRKYLLGKIDRNTANRYLSRV